MLHFVPEKVPITEVAKLSCGGGRPRRPAARLRRPLFAAACPPSAADRRHPRPRVTEAQSPVTRACDRAEVIVTTCLPVPRPPDLYNQVRAAILSNLEQELRKMVE